MYALLDLLRCRGTTLAAVVVFSLIAPAGLAGEPRGPGAVQLAIQNAEAKEIRRKSVIDLQVFRDIASAKARDGTRLRLTSLNPATNDWFVLDVFAPGRPKRSYHIENPAPASRQVTLSSGPAPALVVSEGQAKQSCRPWAGSTSELDEAREAGLPFVAICEERLYLRNTVKGSRTSLERTAEFLRDKVWFGESLVGFVKDTLYKDRYLSSGETVAGADPGKAAEALGRARLRDYPVMYTTMTFDLVGASPGRMQMGSWYAVDGAPGIYASALQPRMIHPDILNRKGETNWLDGIEGRADVYLVGFDLSLLEIGYETGTEHPRLGWSSRPSGAGRNWTLPGPDGFDSPAPLAPTGMIRPDEARRVAATFTGGFKRDHGAFRFGPLATTKHGHHYGFVVHGAVLSRLQPDLATFYVLNDGTVGMKTWTDADDAMLRDIRYARQNGVALIEPDPETGEGVPGKLVRQWLPGNWSGSDKAELRTLRAGACLKQVNGSPFLIYGWFSTATPSAMARTFQAYSCDYAMLLDMNAIEHTYMALYTPEEGGGIDTRYLVEGMRQIDARGRDGKRIPRFVGYADNRDFFYLLHKETGR